VQVIDWNDLSPKWL